jgi:hypothetical protein
MEDDGIRFGKRVERRLQPWLLRKLAENDTPTNGAARSPEPLPAAEARAIAAATERAHAIADRVRDQAFARYAFPWRFEEYPLTELAEGPTDAELEAWMHELEFRYQCAIEGDDEER